MNQIRLRSFKNQDIYTTNHNCAVPQNPRTIPSIKSITSFYYCTHLSHLFNKK